MRTRQAFVQIGCRQDALGTTGQSDSFSNAILVADTDQPLDTHAGHVEQGACRRARHVDSWPPMSVFTFRRLLVIRPVRRVHSAITLRRSRASRQHVVADEQIAALGITEGSTRRSRPPRRVRSVRRRCGRLPAVLYVSKALTMGELYLARRRMSAADARASPATTRSKFACPATTAEHVNVATLKPRA